MPEHAPHNAPVDPGWLEAMVKRALDEDLGGFPGRDVTTQATISRDTVVTGEVVLREPGVLAGVAVITHVCGQVAERFGLDMPDVAVRAKDGDLLEAATHIADLSGQGHVILIAERTILNVLSRASGIATHTRTWVDALAGTGAHVLDTRKTTPGLRELEKYAVRCGGGTNKRMGLNDCAMIKDNHILAAGSVAAAVRAIGAEFPDVPIQVEVERHAQAMEAIETGVRFLMLDNMGIEAMTALVSEVRALEPAIGKVWLEATGGLTLANARSVAGTGVDYMSVGALTHSSPILDIALDLH